MEEKVDKFIYMNIKTFALQKKHHKQSQKTNNKLGEILKLHRSRANLQRLVEGGKKRPQSK